MTTETMNLIAVILGPVVAVAMTLCYQHWRVHHDAKERLFLTLMANRKLWPPAQEWVQALNLIDIVYAAHPKVVGLWHEYYALLDPAQVQAQQQRDHKYLQMLSEMAGALGYKKLQQTDIDKFYHPEAHVNQWQQGALIAQELLRVLQNTERLQVAARENPPQ